MKLTYLGTAAAEGWPALFCRCEYCKKALERGGKNLRTRSQAMVNDDLLIDFPADSFSHMQQNGLNFSAVKTLLITHSHMDHFSPTDLHLRSTSYYAHAKKKVEASRLLDDMTDLSHWRVDSHQELINGAKMDSRGINAGTLTHAERDRRKVARLTCPVDCTEKNADYGRGWGLATLFRDCGHEDWRDYN
ncbi:MAG: hypothetical protein IKV50_00525, partial [Clostridia bacterium]|nr:hypothetical protein [Clostridia bacterium]